MLKYSVLVPTHDNDGKEFSPGTIQKFEFEVMTLTGGLTREGVVEGQWMDQKDRRVYVDKSIKYTIAVKEKDLQMLQVIVKMHMRRLGQISYYYEVDRHTEVNIEFLG